MVVCSGKSKKNFKAYVLLPPDAKECIDLLISTRRAVGIPVTNPYMFARLGANTPYTGNSELQEIVCMCPGLKHPELIKSTLLRKYIATVSQVFTSKLISILLVCIY